MKNFECRSNHSYNVDKFAFLVVKKELPKVVHVMECQDGETSVQLDGVSSLYEVHDLVLGHGEDEDEAWDFAKRVWKKQFVNRRRSKFSPAVIAGLQVLGSIPSDRIPERDLKHNTKKNG